MQGLAEYAFDSIWFAVYKCIRYGDKQIASIRAMTIYFVWTSNSHGTHRVVYWDSVIQCSRSHLIKSPTNSSKASASPERRRAKVIGRVYELCSAWKFVLPFIGESMWETTLDSSIKICRG